MACLFAFTAIPAVTTFAQQLDSLAPDVSGDEQMLLEADTLVYDNDTQTVTAIGGVQIEYAGNRLVAQRVSYDRPTGRLVASGNVELVEADGNRISSDYVDITDDFAQGFVNALRVETPDKTYFGAESAKREGGRLTTFFNGVYTACEPCEEEPDKAPVWRIKARKIIWNGEAKTVRFEQASFEMFGFPIAYLPFFEIADPTVKRKTGFLIPSAGYDDELGASLSIPFYIALAPTYDLTLTGTGYTKQGFLGEAEWRQKFNNGEYSLKIAGIHQRNPGAFIDNTVDSGHEGDRNEFRGMIGSKGRFQINPRWAFGWDILAQTDKNFSNTYDIKDYSDYYFRSEVFLTGLHDRNYFDLRFMKFQVQERTPDELPDGRPILSARNPRQPWVLPSFDYSYTPDEPVAGGELNIDLNSQSIYRDALDLNLRTPIRPVRGIDGSNGRFTAEAEWKRSLIAPGGLVVTPLLHARGDAIYSSMSGDSAAAIGSLAQRLSSASIDYSHNGASYGSVEADIRSAYYRTMATAGLELRWPVLFSTTSSSHVLEPIAQLFVRPNAPHQSILGIPNEDAQSLVFDAASLFERDKFSGYDRMEGGTRANLGIRYSGTFANGWSATALFGQSFHLSGENPFAAPDLVNVGAYSGLETDRSDYVGMIGLLTPVDFALTVGARFDEKTFEVRRADIGSTYSTEPLALSARYSFIEKQPLYGFAEDRHEVTVGANVRLQENWRTFGSGTYDLESRTLVRNSFGFSYDDECFTYAMTYSQSRTPGSPEVTSTSIGFNVSFRTLGEFGSSSGQFAQQ